MSLLRALALTLVATCLLLLPPAAEAAGTGGTAAPASAAEAAGTGGAAAPVTATAQRAGLAGLLAAGSIARLLPDGTAAAPAAAPDAVKRAIWAANRIQGKPYVWGGGHGSFLARGYDCSGAVSYALHGAGLLTAPLDSGSFMRWGAAGRGRWFTVYTNPGHAYVVIAGLRLDTSRAGVWGVPAGSKALETGPRWRPTARAFAGFQARHPAGL